MKNRIFKTIALVAAIVSCVGMTVFAAPSISAGGVCTGVSSAIDAKGTSVKIIIENPQADQKDMVEDIKKEATLKNVLGDKYDANKTVADVKNVRAEGDESLIEYPLTITFNVTGVKEGTVGYLLLNDGSGWRMIPTTVGNGTMTGVFDKLGLVAFVLDKTTVPGGSTTSPQTSASAAALVGVVGIAAASGAVVLKKKER